MTFWNKKVLVTGAGGFIGSHLVERLVSLGADVRTIVRYNSRNEIGLLTFLKPDDIGKVEIKFGDIVELETIHSVMRGVDIVFNLAASVGIPYSYVNPQEVVDINTIGTMNLITAAREMGVERFIQTSTSEVYGTAQYVPIDEKHPKSPQSPYSASKIAADALALSFYNSFDLPVSVLRPFNTYGPRQSDRAVIPAVIAQAMIKDTIQIGNVTPTRDFTYVTDTVEGFIKVAESKDAIGEEINLGSGKEISISDLIRKIVSQVGRDITIEYDGKRVRPSKSEVERLLSDNKKAKELIGWEPVVSLTQGITNTIDFIKANKKMYFPEKYRI